MHAPAWASLPNGLAGPWPGVSLWETPRQQKAEDSINDVLGGGNAAQLTIPDIRKEKKRRSRPQQHAPKEVKPLKTQVKHALNIKAAIRLQNNPYVSARMAAEVYPPQSESMPHRRNALWTRNVWGLVNRRLLATAQLTLQRIKHATRSHSTTQQGSKN